MATDLELMYQGITSFSLIYLGIVIVDALVDKTPRYQNDDWSYDLLRALMPQTHIT
jgi:hypothetical protein